MRKLQCTLALLCILILPLLACKDKSSTGVSVPEPTLENLWPNEDGASWTYDIEYRTWDMAAPVEYETEDEVPPCPTLPQIEELMRDHPEGANLEVSEGEYELTFNGTISNGHGVTTQLLEETIIYNGKTERSVALPGFLGNLRQARPDLAERMDALAAEQQIALPRGGENPSLFPTGYPTFLSGHYWEKTEGYIGQYGDLSDQLSWIYLDANFEVDHLIRFQLVPDLDDDIWLSLKTLRQGAVTTTAGRFIKTIEVLYCIDYGVGPYRSIESPDEFYYTRYFDYGRIVYAPEVGPIFSDERILTNIGDDGYTAGARGAVLNLISSSEID